MIPVKKVPQEENTGILRIPVGITNQAAAAARLTIGKRGQTEDADDNRSPPPRDRPPPARTLGEEGGASRKRFLSKRNQVFASSLWSVRHILLVPL